MGESNGTVGEYKSRLVEHNLVDFLSDCVVGAVAIAIVGVAVSTLSVVVMETCVPAAAFTSVTSSLGMGDRVGIRAGGCVFDSGGGVGLVGT